MVNPHDYNGGKGPVGMKIPNPGGGYGTPGFAGTSIGYSNNNSPGHPSNYNPSTNSSNSNNTNSPGHPSNQNYGNPHVDNSPAHPSNNNYNNPNNNTNANENTNSNNFPGHPSNFNWESDNSSNKSSENNQQTVIDYISVNDETDAKFKSYTTINYANSDIQNVSQKVNAILAANPKWSKMDALNYLDGKWAKQGWKNQDGTPDNRPRWNNGKLKNLEVSDEIAAIKGGQDYNTWGGGLRSRFEGNWGSLTDKQTYEQNLFTRANSQYLEPGSPAALRNKQLSDATKRLRPDTSGGTLANLAGFVIGSIIGFPGLGAMMNKNKQKGIDAKEQELLQSPVLTQQIKDLVGQYNMVSDEIDDYEDTGNMSMDFGNPIGNLMGAYSKKEQLRTALGGDIPRVLKSMTMSGNNLIFNKPMNEGEFKNFKSRLRMIEEEKNDDNDVNYSSYGSRIETETEEENSASNTTIDLADPYIGVAWWKDRGGFEKLFGIALPYPKKDTDTQALKEGGKVGYQLGGTVRPPSMINDPNAAPASLRADDVDLQAEEGDFIMGYPAMQQNGPRVRSIVEQAMLKAKDSGVKTKGYKKGDKVDILVHNGEMHIPNEVVKYIDGGYASLKKLNAPSKYNTGDIIKAEPYTPNPNLENADNLIKAEPYTPNPDIDLDNLIKAEPAPTGFMEKPEGMVNQDNMLNEMQNKIVPKPKPDRPIKPVIKEKPFNYNYTREEQTKKEQAIKKQNVFYVGQNLNWFEDNRWNSIKKSFRNNLPVDYSEREKTAYTNVAMNDLYNSLAGASQANNREIFSKLKSPKFLKQLHNASKANMLMSNASTIAGQDLNYNVALDDNGVIYQYDSANVFTKDNTTNQKDFIQDNTLITFLKKNENDEYKKTGIHLDSKGNKTVGYGHKIKNDEELTYFEKIIKDNGGIFPQELADRLLIQDITLAKNGARKVYNNYIKSISLDKYNSKSVKTKNFDDLDKNRQMMLTELAFNLGAGILDRFGKGSDGLAEFDDFMLGIANNDYSVMEKEYKRLDLDTRNKNFYTIFLSPSLDKM